MREQAPKQPKHWRARLALGAIASIVVSYDALCPKNETISQEVDYLRDNPHTGKITNWIIDSLYHHLKRDVPPEDDPIHQFASYFGKD